MGFLRIEMVTKRLFAIKGESMEERIKNMYNDGWRIYKEYLATHDMAKFNKNMANLCEKYDRQSDIAGLMLWIAARVQGLHDEYRSDK